MTGFGTARDQDERGSVSVEVRSVNNRHFKLTTRASEPLAALESEWEPLVRQYVRRGTVSLQVRVERPRRAEDYRINAVALQSYRQQLEALGATPALADLLGLPGVVEDRRIAEADSDPRDDWPRIAAVTVQALEQLRQSRAREGHAMVEQLGRLIDQIGAHRSAIADRLPEAMAAYRDRLLERLRALVAGLGATIEPNDLVREMAIYADRTNVAEELTRLQAHVDEFKAALRGADREREGGGRHLEFLTQELLRETNTLGSKANDPEVSRRVIESKGLLESIRELILNLE